MPFEGAKHKTDCVNFEWKYVNYGPMFDVSKYWNAGDRMYIAQCRKAEVKDWFGRPVLYPCEQCPYYEQVGYAAIRFTIFGADDQQILDAGQDDLSLFERAWGTVPYAPERLLSFSNTGTTAIPVTAVICIDRSDSMSADLPNVLTAMSNMVEEMWYHGEAVVGTPDIGDPSLIDYADTNSPAADLTAVVSSDATVSVDVPMASAESGTTAITSVIEALTAGSGSAVFDAISRAVELLAYSNGSGDLSIFLVSNGNDDSSTATKQEAIDAAVAAGVKVHTIVITGHQNDPTVLRDIATGTGGTYVMCSSREDIESSAKIIRDGLHGGGYQMLWRTWVTPTRVGEARVVHTNGAVATAIFRSALVPFNYRTALEKSPPG